MATEIERKFLVLHDGWKPSVTQAERIVQAYLCRDPERTVRVRIKGDQAFLTIKGQPVTGGFAVPEFEYAIPYEDADALLKLCLPGAIVKTRHLVPYARKTWEIDVFEGDNAGLVMAEIELASEDEEFEKPAWLGAEVTHDNSYKNTALSEQAFIP